MRGGSIAGETHKQRWVTWCLQKRGYTGTWKTFVLEQHRRGFSAVKIAIALVQLYGIDPPIDASTIAAWTKAALCEQQRNKREPEGLSLPAKAGKTVF